MNSEKGFSTIELILAIAIAGIIMGAVGTFLTFNLRSFNATTDVINVQYEGQLAMNQLTDIMKQSSGFTVLDDGGSPADNYLNRSDRLTPYYMEFEHVFSDTNDPTTLVTTTYQLTYDEVNGLILVDVITGGVTDSYTLASNVVGFEIESSDITVNYNNTNSVRLYLALRDNDAILDLETQVKFRNKR